jgi:hypothetical protein
LCVSLGIETNKTQKVMENLFLNIVQNYFIVGVVLAVVIDIAIRVIKVSRPFNLKDIAVVALAWPIIVSSLATDFINGDL